MDLRIWLPVILRISSIIDDHLSYSRIFEFMENKASFEEVIYRNGHLPTQMELKYFEAELRKNYDISDAVEQCILIQSRPHLHSNECLRFNSLLLGFTMDAEERSVEAIYQSIELDGKLPTIMTFCIAYVLVNAPQKPREDLGFMANFLHAEWCWTSEIEIEAMNKALILHADHELNASTFAARVCASTRQISILVQTAIGA